MAKDNKRKNPKQSRSSEMLSDILEGTKRGLLKFGGNKLSTNKISEITGISVGSFYQYFKNKEAAFLELSENLGDLTNNRLAEIYKETEDVPIEERVEFIVDAYVEMFLNHKTYFNTLSQIVYRFNKAELFFNRRKKFHLLAAEEFQKATGKSEEECLKFTYFLINQITGTLHAVAQYDENHLSIDETKSYIRSSVNHLVTEFLENKESK